MDDKKMSGVIVLFSCHPSSCHQCFLEDLRTQREITIERPKCFMEIDLKVWGTALDELSQTVLPSETHVSTDPEDFFSRFFCEGFPAAAQYSPLWREKGIVVYVDSAQTFNFDLKRNRWKKEQGTPTFRYFWVNQHGVLGEVSPLDWHVNEFFPVSSPNVAAEYIALICGKQLERTSGNSVREVPISHAVTGSYVHYFRYPDDLSPEIDKLPWISTRILGDLIKKHAEESVSWLGPFLKEFQLSEWRQKVKSEREQDKAIRWGKGGEMISKEEMFLRLETLFSKDTSSLRRDCLTARTKIKDGDLLEPGAEWRLQKFWLPYAYPKDHPEMGPQMALEVAVLPVKQVFPDFLSAEVNPSARDAIRKHVLLSLLDANSEQTPTTIALPSEMNQRRLAFEAKAYRHAIARVSQKLIHFQSGTETPEMLKGFLANRFQEVSTLIGRMPIYDAEQERSLRPLPYFIEAPLLAWERASNNFKIQHGFMAFGNLLRQVTLLGLTEVQAQRKNWQEFTPPLTEVVSKIRGNPSLGDWSKCLDWLSAYVKALPIFGDWIEILNQHRVQTIGVIELRNKYVHPASILNNRFLNTINQELETFLIKIVRELRTLDCVRMYLPLSRMAVRQSGDTVFEFTAQDVLSPYENFRETRFRLAASSDLNIVEKELLAVNRRNPPNMLSLEPLFRSREASPEKYGIVIYEKAFNGTSGLFSAVDSEEQHRLPMLKSPLEFE